MAGLLMGSMLSKHGYQVEIFEKSPRLGGKVGTEQTPTGPVEWGPNAIFATEEITEWLKDLGLELVHTRPRLKRWIWSQCERQSPRRRDILKRVLPRLIKRAPLITPSTTVADYLRPLLGARQIDALVSPALQGIYGTTADQLTVLSLWPQLERYESLVYWKALKLIRGPKAKSTSFPQGMQEFVDALAKSIQGTIHLNYQGEFELRPNTIICTDAHTAASLLENQWRDGAKLLRTISYLPISSSTLHSSIRLPWSEQGFGVLFPRKEDMHSLGCLFNHSIFPGRVAKPASSSITFILSDTTDPKALIDQDLQKLDWPSGDLLQKVYKYPLGLPLYNEARWSAIRQLHQSPTRPKSLVVFGNYVAGISLRDMINTASSFAEGLGVE